MKISLDKLMLATILVLTLIEALTHFSIAYPDSPSYVAAAHFFQGRPLTSAGRFRLLRPLVPSLASLVNLFVDMRTAFAIVNLVFWCGSAMLLFYFTKLLTRDSDAAFTSALFFTTAIPMLLFGDAILTDMAGYFFILLGLYLMVKWDIRRATLPRVLLAAIVVGMGILSKENVACVLLFGLVWVILSKPSLGSISRVLFCLIIGIGMSLIWSSMIGVSYLEWYKQGGLIYAGAYQQLGLRFQLRMLIISIQYGFGKYGEVLILALLGFLRIEHKDHFRIQISILLAALAIILAWPIIDTRFAFILFPSILPLAGVGVKEAYDIIFRSRLISSTIWPSFTPSRKSLMIFSLLVVVLYVLITNAILFRYISFPWAPLTDPAVSIADLR